MGVKLSSCCLPKDKQEDDDVNERTRILSDPTDGGMYSDGDGVGGSNGFNSGMYGSINDEYSSKNDQASAWDRTRHKMLRSVIDVSSMNAPQNNMEHSETAERSRMYVARINQIRPATQTPKSRTKSSKSSQSTKRFEISTPPKFTVIADDDVRLINETLDKSLEAIKQGFVVKTEHDLIVEFVP